MREVYEILAYKVFYVCMANSCGVVTQATI